MIAPAKIKRRQGLSAFVGVDRTIMACLFEREVEILQKDGSHMINQRMALVVFVL